MSIEKNLLWNENASFIRKLSWFFAEFLEIFRRIFRKFFNKFGNIFKVLLFYFSVSKSLEYINRYRFTLLHITVRGPATGRRRIFEIFHKISEKIYQKKHYLRILCQKDLTNHVVIYRVFGRNTQIVGEFSKVFKRFRKKIAKIHYFSMLQKNFTNLS